MPEGTPTTTNDHAVIADRTGRTPSEMSFISLMTLYSFDPRRSSALRQNQLMGAPTFNFANSVFTRPDGFGAAVDNFWVNFNYQPGLLANYNVQGNNWRFVEHRNLVPGLDALVLVGPDNVPMIFLDATDLGRSSSPGEPGIDVSIDFEISMGTDPVTGAARVEQATAAVRAYIEQVAARYSTDVDIAGLSQGGYFGQVGALLRPDLVRDVFSFGAPPINEVWVAQRLSSFAAGSDIPSFFLYELTNDSVPNAAPLDAAPLDRVAQDLNLPLNVVRYETHFTFGQAPWDFADHTFGYLMLEGLYSLAPSGFSTLIRYPQGPFLDMFSVRSYSARGYDHTNSAHVPRGREPGPSFFPIEFDPDQSTGFRLFAPGGRDIVGWRPPSIAEYLNQSLPFVLPISSAYYEAITDIAFGLTSGSFFATILQDSTGDVIAPEGRGWISVLRPSSDLPVIEVQRDENGIDWLRIDRNLDSVFEQYVALTTEGVLSLRQIISPPGDFDQTSAPNEARRLGTVQSDDVFWSSSGLSINVGQVAGILGATITRGLVQDPLAGAVAGVLIGALSENVAEGVALAFQDKYSVSTGLNEAFRDFLPNLGTLAAGSISSLLVADLFDSLGIEGPVGDFAQSLASDYVTRIVSNLPAIANGHYESLSQGFTANQIANSFGGFIGAFLASKLVHFETIGGQIGASAGAAIGTAIASQFIGKGASLALNLVIPGIGAFIGFIIGGLIGSLFGGTPKGGAAVNWNERTQQFQVGNVWSKNGGSKDAVRSMAANVVRRPPFGPALERRVLDRGKALKCGNPVSRRNRSLPCWLSRSAG